MRLLAYNKRHEKRRIGGNMLIHSVLCAEAHVTTSNYRLAPQVIFLQIQDGSARLLDLGGNFYAISPMGARMLSETLKVGTRTAAERIATEYPTERSCVRRDLHAFLHDLEKKRLIYANKLFRKKTQSKYTLSLSILLPLLRYISIRPTSLEKKAWVLLMLAAVSLRLFGWPQTIASWQAYLQKHASGSPTAPLEQSVKDIDHIVCTVAACHPFHVECKERALTCWWLLATAGFSASLVLGVTLFPLGCHCWCEAGQFVINNDQDRYEQFTPICSYGV